MPCVQSVSCTPSSFGQPHEDVRVLGTPTVSEWLSKLERGCSHRTMHAGEGTGWTAGPGAPSPSPGVPLTACEAGWESFPD